MGQVSVTSIVFIKVLYALSIGLLLRASIRKVPTSVYTCTESISIDGLSAADRMALSVAMQQRCRPLYDEKSDDKNTPSPLLHTLTHTHTFTHTLTHSHSYTHSHTHSHTHIYTRTLTRTLTHTFTHTHSHTHTHTHTAVTWLKIRGGKQNRPRVLGTLIYEGVNLESGENLVWTRT